MSCRGHDQIRSAWPSRVSSTANPTMANGDQLLPSARVKHALIVIVDHRGGSYIGCFSVLCTVKLSHLALRRRVRARERHGRHRPSCPSERERSVPRHEVDATGFERRDLDGHRHLDELCLG
jgi:hypothetical protein